MYRYPKVAPGDQLDGKLRPGITHILDSMYNELDAIKQAFAASSSSDPKALLVLLLETLVSP